MSKQAMTGVVGVLIVTVGLTAPGAVGATRQEKMQEIDEDLSLTTRLVTPHKKWAKPYAKGAVRALVVLHGGGYMGKWAAPGTRAREIVELMQRFDVQAEMIMVGGRGRGDDFYRGELGKQRAERLLAKKYDVFIFTSFHLDKLPAKFQFMVLSQVAKGAGLVCCGAKATEFMVPKRRVKPLPVALYESIPVAEMARRVVSLEKRAPAGKDNAWVADKLMQVYRLKNGRGVYLTFPCHALTPRREFSHAAVAEYDYWMLLAGRAVLWAAGREPDVSITSIVAPDAKAGAPGAKASVTLTSGKSGNTPVKVAMAIRRSDGWRQSLGVVATTLVAGKPTRLTVPIPRLRQDRYLIDAVVTSARGTEACGAGAMVVTGPYGVDKVAMGATYVERGQTIKGTATLRGTPPTGSTLRIRLRDSYGRVLVQKDMPVKAGQKTYPFDYRADAFATILMRAEAVLMQAGREIELAEASFTVPKRRRKQFNFLQWDTPTDPLGCYAWDQLKQAGMNVCLFGAFSESKPRHVLRASDIAMVPYTTRILDPKDPKGFMKPCCWNDEPKVTQHVERIADNQKWHREHGVWVYSLGDEGVTKGCCVHPACIAAYRRYLKAQYATIARLNASWGATYKSFDQVDLLVRKENMEREAVGKNLCARWYDRQAFARHNLMQLSGRFGRAFKKRDPQAVTGFEGTGGFGDDFDLITSINTFYSPYPSIGDDILRSVAPRTLIRANWMGYSKVIDPLADAAWRMVMKHMDSIWWWMWTGIGAYRGYLTPTLDLWPATAELADEMRPVRRGLGDLLIQSPVVHSGIAVHYSLPSALSHSLENGREFQAPKAVHEAWTRLTYDLGLDVHYVSCAMLRRGALDPRQFKVVLLLMSQAIGPDEAKAIRAFAQAGGTVIADVRPGIYDHHCKPETPGVLDALFGIRRTGRGKVRKANLDIRGSLAGQALTLKAKNVRVDTQVACASAKALARAGDTPLVLVNRVGQGRTILLNFQLNTPRQDDAETDAARSLVAALYRVAGAKAPVVSTSPGGGPLPLVETRVWRNGEATVIGMWRMMTCRWFAPSSGTEAGPPMPAKITLPKAQHVYDLRAGTYLGQVREVSTSLRWGRANFFVALPYPITGVTVEAPKTPRRGQVLTATIRLGVPAGAKARHAVFVEVLDPAGQSVLWARRALVLSAGSGRVRIPIAYNDAPGPWRVRATELWSGKSAEATWTVR